jgi:WD40 repeat protein
MSLHRKFLGASVAVAAAAGSLLVAGVAPASADGTTPLPLSSYSNFVVDGAHRHLLISDPRGSKIVVTDYSGTVVGQITGEYGAEGLALSADSSTLFVALHSGDAVSAIDTATLTESARYHTGAGTAPAHLAVVGGTLWFGYGDSGSGRLGSIDVSAADPQVTLDPNTGYEFYAAPVLTASPSAPGVLVAAEAGVSPATVTVYDVSSGTAVQKLSVWDPGGDTSNLQDMAITPDGQDLVIASGSPYVHQVFRLSDFSADGDYPTGTYPDAVAIAPDGTVAAGVDADYDPDVYVFAQGQSTPRHSYELGEDLLPAGLAWDPSGTVLFALTSDGLGGPVSLHVIGAPDSPSTVTISGPATARKGHALTLKGKLTSTEPVTAGSKVTLTRTDSADPDGTVVTTVPVKAGGAWKAADIPPVKGSVVYRIDYAGDAVHGAASASTTVTVTK